VRYTRSWWSSTSLLCSLLLATRKPAIELAIDEKIGANSTGTPGNAVRPSLDARVYGSRI